MTRTLKRTALFTSLFLLGATIPVLADSTGGPAAFEKLKTLAGSWQGRAEGNGEAMEVRHDFRVSANGSVVMETMNPGGDHEMINMYHLDGDDLVLTHYCAGGNQPTMKLVRSSAEEMHFDFTGGTNLDPGKDPHIHAGSIVIVDAETIEATWTAFNEGKEAGAQTFTLQRDQ